MHPQPSVMWSEPGGLESLYAYEDPSAHVPPAPTTPAHPPPPPVPSLPPPVHPPILASHVYAQATSAPVAVAQTGTVDRMLVVRRDVLKLAIYVLIIVAALNLHDTILTYIRKYLVQGGGRNELIVRLSPLMAILIAVWLMKAHRDA